MYGVPATVSATGLASGITSMGVTSIFASLGTVSSGSAAVEGTPPVLVSIAITPANPSVGIGLSLQLTAIGTFNNGSTAKLTDSLQWGPPGVVSSTGLAMSMYPGNIPVFVDSSGSNQLRFFFLAQVQSHGH